MHVNNFESNTKAFAMADFIAESTVVLTLSDHKSDSGHIEHVRNLTNTQSCCLKFQC